MIKRQLLIWVISFWEGFDLRFFMHTEHSWIPEPETRAQNQSPESGQQAQAQMEQGIFRSKRLKDSRELALVTRAISYLSRQLTCLPIINSMSSGPSPNDDNHYHSTILIIGSYERLAVSRCALMWFRGLWFVLPFYGFLTFFKALAVFNSWHWLRLEGFAMVDIFEPTFILFLFFTLKNLASIT